MGGCAALAGFVTPTASVAALISFSGGTPASVLATGCLNVKPKAGATGEELMLEEGVSFAPVLTEAAVEAAEVVCSVAVSVSGRYFQRMIQLAKPS